MLHNSRNFSRQSGFSLIELMVSIALGLLIMSGVLAIYLDVSRNNTELAKMNRQIENGRFTIQFLQQELWHAGFWDGYIPPLPSATPPTTIPNPCTDFASWTAADIENIYAIPVQGFANGAGLPAECAGIVSNPQASSDILVVRYTNTCVAGIANCEDYNAAKLYLQTQGCNDLFNIKYKSDFAIKPSLGTPGEEVFKKDCATPADKRKLITSLFYVRNYSVTVGDGKPTLMRADLDLNAGVIAMQAAQPVLEGVQSIKFEYGRDTDDNGSADVYDDCSVCTATDWANVVTVNMYVLARNLEATAGYVEDKTYVLGQTALGPFGDGFKRHVYNSFVRLVNVSGRRERP